jgi:hypothetical protein
MGIIPTKGTTHKWGYISVIIMEGVVFCGRVCSFYLGVVSISFWCIVILWDYSSVIIIEGVVILREGVFILFEGTDGVRFLWVYHNYGGVVIIFCGRGVHYLGTGCQFPLGV